MAEEISLAVLWKAMVVVEGWGQGEDIRKMPPLDQRGLPEEYIIVISKLVTQGNSSHLLANCIYGRLPQLPLLGCKYSRGEAWTVGGDGGSSWHGNVMTAGGKRGREAGGEGGEGSRGVRRSGDSVVIFRMYPLRRFQFLCY